MLTVQIDMDGVLADWDSAFEHVSSIFGKCTVAFPPERWTTRDNYDPPEAYDKAWELLKNTPWWWCSLKPLVYGDEFERIARLSRDARVYFVTNRMHNVNSPVEQTAAWLRAHGVPHPSVICHAHKDTAALFLHTDYSIEDKYENADRIRFNSPRTASYLLNRPWNRDELFDRQFLYPAKLRVPTVTAFLDIIEKVVYDSTN